MRDGFRLGVRQCQQCVGEMVVGVQVTGCRTGLLVHDAMIAKVALRTADSSAPPLRERGVARELREVVGGT